MTFFLTTRVTAANPVVGDLYLNEAKSAVVVPDDSIEAIAQRWQSRIQLVRSEWFIDANLGNPWFGDTPPNVGLLGRKGTRENLALVRDRVRQCTRGTRGIKEILGMTDTYDKPTRQQSFDVRVKCVDGTKITLSTTV